MCYFSLRVWACSARGIVDSVHACMHWIVVIRVSKVCAPMQALSMGGVQLSLRATADKMVKVMSEPQKRRVVFMGSGAVVLLFLLYLWLKR